MRYLFLALVLLVLVTLPVTGLLVVMFTDPSSRSFRATQCCPRPCVAGAAQRIPRVIHRTWKTNDLLPQHKTAWDETAKHNPEYTQKLWTDADSLAFMDRIGGRVARAYRSLVPGAAKADLFRYCVLLHEGGVYLDAKSGARELCQLIGPMDEMIVSSWGDTRGWPLLNQFYSFGELQQWWLAATPGHPTMKAVVDAVVEAVERRQEEGRLAKERVGSLWYRGYNVDVLALTGPLRFTEAVLAHPDGVRATCPNGNGTMIYDVAGTHKGAAYGTPGPMLHAATA